MSRYVFEVEPVTAAKCLYCGAHIIPVGAWWEGADGLTACAQKPTRCPTCDSRQPSMHPAVSGGSEVTHICPDAFHDGDPVTEAARHMFPARQAEANGPVPGESVFTAPVLHEPMPDGLKGSPA